MERDSDGHDPYRPGGLSAAFLDRTSKAVPGLRHWHCRAAGDRDGPCARARVSHLGNDRTTRVLPAKRIAPRDRTKEAWTKSRVTHRRRDVRQLRLESDDDDCKTNRRRRP